MARVFLSYSHKNTAEAEACLAILRDAGHQCWIDREMPPGCIWRDELTRSLVSADVFCVLLSEPANRSDDVLKEISIAAQKKAPILAIRLDRTDLPQQYAYELTARQWLDAADGFVTERHGRELRDAVRRLTTPGEPPPDPTPDAPRFQFKTRTGEHGLVYVWVPPGEFTMGAIADDREAGPEEKPARTVVISAGFWMTATPVTERAWSAQMGRGRSTQTDAGLPITQISWDLASEYCRSAGGRLPTEAEWEYAARGGLAGQIYAPVDPPARLRSVGMSPKNYFGLQDCTGLVWQWCQDRYSDVGYTRRPARDVDPRGPESGATYVVRGGAFDSPRPHTRLSARQGRNPRVFASLRSVGFRCIVLR